MPPSKEDFTSRWSRLKREKASPSETAEPDPIVSGVENSTSEITAEPEIPDADLTDSELLEKYELPDPDGMKTGDDFSVFMKKAVPERLRRRALRVLWGSNPILANLDELVDYGEDFTDAATVVENMQTIYQVGKGSAWKFQAEQKRVAEEKAAAAADEAERRAHNGEPEEDPEIETAEQIEPDEPIIEDLDQEMELAVLSEDQADHAPPLPPRPRPMQFEFD